MSLVVVTVDGFAKGVGVCAYLQACCHDIFGCRILLKEGASETMLNIKIAAKDI
jgi:hypothetical protein